VLLATFANLRFGEFAALHRDQLDLDTCEVRVTASMAQMNDGRLIDGGPKSRAGNRTVSFPADIVPELAEHIERFVGPDPHALVFVGPKGGRLRRQNFAKFWDQAREAVGMPELHFHDLRHTGNTMAAAQGASLRELMEQMGTQVPAPRSSTSTPPASATRRSRRAWAGSIATPGVTCPEERARLKAIGHATGTRHLVGVSGRAAKEPIYRTELHRKHGSGRRESNPHDQLGRLGLCH